MGIDPRHVVFGLEGLIERNGVNYMVRSVKMDGNCMFNAILQQIGGPYVLSRREVVQILRKKIRSSFSVYVDTWNLDDLMG